MISVLPWQMKSTLIIFLYLHLSLIFLLKRLIFQGFPTFEFSFLFKVSSQIFSYFLMFFPAILVNPLVKQASLPTGFLTICYPIYFFLCIIKIHMGVSVQGLKPSTHRTLRYEALCEKEYRLHHSIC